MEKWKTIRNVTLAILIVFIAFLLIIGLGFVTDDATYPDSVWGLTRFESFELVMGYILIVSGIPLLIDIILLIISLIKIKKSKLKNLNNTFK